MGKKTSESSKYREWERERRERLNVSFNDLGSLLPNHDPAIVTSKVDILQKSAAYIRDLKKENSDLLLSGASKLQVKKIKRLQRYVEALLLRVQQLAKLLRDAGITLPPEPPTISPLGEKIPRWSNKISPKDAEQALEAEKNSKSSSQKKVKITKKDTKSPSKKDGPPNKSPTKTDNPSTLSKIPSSTEASLSGNKLRSSLQNADKDSSKIPVLSADRRPQESGTSIPVGQLFGDSARILTSLPPHVVGSDQQPGIIVIRTTGASTLGAVTQHPPQSTCFVIDNGSRGPVTNGQPSAIVASHPPTLEPRPTFVLASNGSLLPVLPAPQFVAQPRQLIVSSSSQVSATNQSLAPIAFSSSASNSQCIKPLGHSLREVKCSQPGDPSQMKKVPIPALPRNKQKLSSNSKEVSEAAGKTVNKKKCVSVHGEVSKTSKGATLKNVEKKNNKSLTENSPQVKVGVSDPSQKDTPPKNKIPVVKENESSPEKTENTASVSSNAIANDSVDGSRKREMLEASGEDSIHAKKRKTEDARKSGVDDLGAKDEETSNGASLEPKNDGTSVSNSEQISNTTYPLNGSVSSYSINALCKMNEKISGCDSVGSIKDNLSSRKEKFSVDETNSLKEASDQMVENSCSSGSHASVSSVENGCSSGNHTSVSTSVPEHSLKSISSGGVVEIHPKERDRLSSDGNKMVDLSSKVDRENYLSVYPSSEHCSQENTDTSLVDTQNVVPPCNLESISHSVEDSPRRTDKGSTLSCSELKGKDDSQSSILPTFGSSQSFTHAEDSYRKEMGRDSNCGNNTMDESSLPPGAFSSDLFASLQVPSGHSESISPTAAFLLAFPLVSTLTGKTPDLGSDNHHSQPLASMENGGGDNDLSSGGCGNSFLQLGNLEENSPSSSTHSILSSLTSSNPCSQSTILHLKSANTVHSLVPRSEEHNYGIGSVETNIHLEERQVTPSKDISLKVVSSKVHPYVPPTSSPQLAAEERVVQNSKGKETDSSAAKMESLSSKSNSSKESDGACIGTLNENIPSQDRNGISSISHSSQTQKIPHEDNQVVSMSSQNNGQRDTSVSNKSHGEPCQPFEVGGRTENSKKNNMENRMFSSDQQYISYQLPHIACSATDLPESISTSTTVTPNTGDSSSNRGLRQGIQTMEHSVSVPNLPQNQANLTFQRIDHSFKPGTRPQNASKEAQNREHNFSNNYAPPNPPNASIPPPISSSSCFSISSFTTSFPSTIANSLLPSCIVTNSSPSFSSANSAPLLMTSSSYSTSSVTYPPHANALYTNSSSSCMTPMYSSSMTPALGSSTASFPNSSLSTVPVSIPSTAPGSQITVCSKISSSSSVALSATHSDAYHNHQGNVITNLLPAPVFSSTSLNSVTPSLNDCSPKENSQPVPSTQLQGSHTLKDSSIEHKGHNHGNPSNMHPHTSESLKSHNIFSVDQLNNQNYSYNFNDYSSHMPSYMPQKQELDMMTKKSSAVLSETHGGNISSRMPGSFSVAHNSSNFSILSWTTLSPMSAAPSSSIDPQMSNMNGKADAYSSSPTSLGLSSGENGPPVTGKVSDSNVSSFPQSTMPDGRDITNLYQQYPMGNNNASAEMNALSSYPMPQDVSKQTPTRGQGPKPRQQVTNWMTAPDPIHSSSDYAHNSESGSGDHVRDAFGSATYNSNSGYYTHHNQSEMPYVSSSNASLGCNSVLDRSCVPSVASGTGGNAQKSCPSISEHSRPVGENILHLQSKPSDAHQNHLTSCTYNKMTSSSTSYVHGSHSELPALPTLVGDLALGSCNSIKGFLPVYDESNPSTSKPGKQSNVKVQSSNSNTVGCGSAVSVKENRDGRSTSSNHEYGGSSFLSVSQLVDHVKDSSHQTQTRENERPSAEKGRNRDSNKTAPTSRRNIRQSNGKKDGSIASKELQESPQMYHSRVPPHGSQTFTNQGISPSIVSSNPTHFHAPPIPFPPYNSVHWPVNEMTKVTDNTRSTANYKSSSSYSAEALIRPSLSTVALDSRLPEVEMSTYGMDIHKYPIPGGRGDHLFTDFVDSNVIGSNMDNVSLPQNHSKQNAQEHRDANDNFRSGHHSGCDKFNYSTNTAPAPFHSHQHPSHVPPSFANNDDFSVESGNHTSSLGLSSNCMDFAPFSHSKESGPVTSSLSNVCASIGYSSPSIGSVGINQNQSHSCRSQEGKMSMRASGGNSAEMCGGITSAVQVGSSKPVCSAEGGAKQVTKDSGVSHNSRPVPPFLPMESSASSYIGHHYPHNHRHHNPATHYSSGHAMDGSSITSQNGSEPQVSKLFPRFPAPASGGNHLSHQSASAGSGVGNSSHLSSGTLTNFNLSTIFPEINDKQTHHSHVTPSTSSFETSTKSTKLCPVTSAPPLLPPPSPMPSSYHHYRPHQHSHQPFPPSVDLGSRLPPSHPPSGVLHSNVGFNNLMVQSTPQVNGIGPLQPPPPPFSAPSFTNVLPGL